jgi:predicted NodU family carbamoyl transferase
MSNNTDQYISFHIDGHDSNICFYRPSDNKLLSLELERVWGQRYFIYGRLSESEKDYFFKYVKKIAEDFGFDDVFKTGLFTIPSPGSNEICLDYYTRVQKEFGIVNVYRYNHHDCHAASAFYDSEYDSAFVVSYDGGGNDGMYSLYEANKNDGLKRLNDHDFLDFTTNYSLASIYIKEISKSSDRTLNILTGAGKLMGLSAYGSYNKELYDKCYKFLTTKSFPDYTTFFNIIDDGKSTNSFNGKSAYDLAFNIQFAFENLFLEKFKTHFNSIIYKNVCLTGGGALNVLLNDKLSKMYPNTNFYVPCSPNDSGISYGIMCLHLKKKLIKEPMYSGCQILDKETLPHILTYRPWQHADPSLIAKELFNGKIIGLCQGNSEVGPRALGNRSILAHPGLFNIKDDINKKVKFREWFRPFAPVCCEEDAHKYFETSNNVNYSYMSYSPKVREEYRKMLPAITHVDGSSRLQTLKSEQNPYLYEILREFEKLSGYPILVNTSFNVRGKSILTHYQAALQNLDSTQLDGVILEKYYISK